MGWVLFRDALLSVTPANTDDEGLLTGRRLVDATGGTERCPDGPEEGAEDLCCIVRSKRNFDFFGADGVGDAFRKASALLGVLGFSSPLLASVSLSCLVDVTFGEESVSSNEMGTPDFRRANMRRLFSSFSSSDALSPGSPPMSFPSLSLPVRTTLFIACDSPEGSTDGPSETDVLVLSADTAAECRDALNFDTFDFGGFEERVASKGTSCINHQGQYLDVRFFCGQDLG